MSEYKVETPLSAVEQRKCDSLASMSELLTGLGIENHPTAKDLRIVCPNCGVNSKEKTLSVYFKDGRPLWKCFKCNLSRTKFNTLIGLYRAFHNCNPWEAVNALFDEAFKNERPSKVRFPLNVDGLRGKLLHECPPHKLYWALISATGPAFTQEIKDAITERLYDVAPF